jgi:PAS domain S-box-containing protein
MPLSRAITLLKQTLFSVFGQRAILQNSVEQEENTFDANSTTARKKTDQLKSQPTIFLPLNDDTNRVGILQEREKLLCKVVEAIPDILLLYDIPRKDCLYVNRQLATALELSMESIERLGAALLKNLLYPDDFSLFSEHIDKCVAMLDGDVFEAEYRFRHATGEWRWFHYRDTVFTRGEDGAPHLMLCAVRDINSHKQNEEISRDLQIQATLGRLTSHLAYEINTPLANIKNLLFLLKKTLTPDHPEAKYLHWTEDEVERIALTIRRILTLPRSDL